MKLELNINDSDLIPKYKMLPISCLRYEHFKKDVQEAIDYCGKATMRRLNSYQVIYPNRGEKQ